MIAVTLLTTSALLAALGTASPATQLHERQSNSNTPAVSVKGNAFFAGSNRFYVRGIDYQPGGPSNPVDPIANAATCARDVVEFKKLGINTVRVYTVDNTANHDACMASLANAGIYLALDVNSAKYSLNRANVAPSYNDVYLQSVFATIDAFAKYDNTLLFFSGNEVINTPQTSNCAPYIKAVTRDMKQYIASRKYRSIPVGYSAADVSENRYQTAVYMQCGTSDQRSDFFAFNDYSWCPPNTFQGSGWAAKVQMYQNYSIPLFLSEYGCNKAVPRTFEETAALYNPEMTSVYSGGLVYEYSEEADNPNYGLVTITSSTAVTEKQDFTNLMNELSANPSPSGTGGYNASPQVLACPPADQYWNVSSDALPAMPANAKKYLTQGAGPGPGLTGAGSQNAGQASTGTATASSSTASGTHTATGTSTATARAAASALQPPVLGKAGLLSGLMVVVSTVVGAALF